MSRRIISDLAYDLARSRLLANVLLFAMAPMLAVAVSSWLETLEAEAALRKCQEWRAIDE